MTTSSTPLRDLSDQLKTIEETILGQSLMPSQRAAVEQWNKEQNPDRFCLFHPPGKGKTISMLMLVYLWFETIAKERYPKIDYRDVVVVAPPVTHESWIRVGRGFGLNVLPMSHKSFRETKNRFSRMVPIIVDEFHLLGRHSSMGWRRMRSIASGIGAMVLIGSATPQYNDVERVYCVLNVLDPIDTGNNYLEWIMNNCVTKVNPFGVIPLVEKPKYFDDAPKMLAAHRLVSYVEDEISLDIVQTVRVEVPRDEIFENYNLVPVMNTTEGNPFPPRIIASEIEKKHARAVMHISGAANRAQDQPELVGYSWGSLMSAPVLDAILPLIEEGLKEKRVVMLFAQHTEIIDILRSALINRHKVPGSYYFAVAAVTGKMTKKKKEEELAAVLSTESNVVLLGTATLATGFDGLDKVCDTLIIVDELFKDPAFRRQLIGRILPRGTSTDVSNKKIYSLEYVHVSPSI